MSKSMATKGGEMSAYMRGFWEGFINGFISTIFLTLIIYCLYTVLTIKGLGI